VDGAYDYMKKKRQIEHFQRMKEFVEETAARTANRPGMSNVMIKNAQQLSPF
jgi:hypothetical protein